MRTSKIEKPFSRSSTRVAGLIVLIVAGCADGDAKARKAAPTKAGVVQTQQQKPVKLRYYGGPKYPMYPE